MRSTSALIWKETFVVGMLRVGWPLVFRRAMTDKPNGACVPVGEPGPKIPADALVRLRMAVWSCRVIPFRRLPVYLPFLGRSPITAYAKENQKNQKSEEKSIH